MAKNKLAEGIVGRVMVEWFRNNENPDNLPVDVMYLNNKDGEYNYRFYFEDGSIVDYHVRYESNWTNDDPYWVSGGPVIESCEEFNRVI